MGADPADSITRLAAEAEALAAEEAEQRRLQARSLRIGGERAEAERLLAQAAEEAQAEADDVARLESWSPTRVLASLRGSRDDDLRREEAEAERAAYALARARDARDRVVQDERDLRARLEAIGDVAQRREALRREVLAVAARSDGARAAQAAELADRVGVLADAVREIEEAHAAADSARQVLSRAADLLDSAGSWSTYDTFFGGGLIADAVKHDRLDQAQRLMQESDRAMRRLSRELADLGHGPVGSLGISEALSFFDVFFDNIISDWMVRDRIAQAGTRVRAARSTVDEVRSRLRKSLTEQRDALAAARRERDRLADGLLGGS